MMKSGLLLISNPNIILRTLPLIHSEAINTVYIQYFPLIKWKINFNINNVGSKRTENWSLNSNKVVYLYSKMLGCKNLDVRVILSGIKSTMFCKVSNKTPVDVIYYDRLFGKEEVHKYVNSWIQNKTSSYQIVELQNLNDVYSEEDSNQNYDNRIFDNVVLGGTFDRLHYGHKILLSEAILHCQKKITVGVTDFQMLKGTIYCIVY